MEELAVHEAAEIFPLMTQTELDALATSIQERGLLRPIVLQDGKILDGRARYLACQMTGVEPRFRKINLTGFSPYEYVIRRNLEARNLGVPGRAAIGAELLPVLQKIGAERKKFLLTKGNTRDDLPEELGQPGQRALDVLSDLLNIGASSIERAVLVTKKRPDLLPRMKAGEFKTLNQARRAAGEMWRGGVLHSEGKVKQYGRGDRWIDASKPIRLYLNGWKRRDFEFKHVNPVEARKRLKEIAAIQEGLEAMKADLEGRSTKARTHFDNRDIKPQERE